MANQLHPVMFFGGPKHGQCLDVPGETSVMDFPKEKEECVPISWIPKKASTDWTVCRVTYHRELVEFTIFNQVMRWYCFSVDASHPDYSAAVKAASTFSRFLVAAKGGEVYLRDMRVVAFMMAESHMAEDFMTRRCGVLRLASCGFMFAMKGIAMRGSHSA